MLVRKINVVFVWKLNDFSPVVNLELMLSIFIVPDRMLNVEAAVSSNNNLNNIGLTSGLYRKWLSACQKVWFGASFLKLQHNQM